MAGSQNDAQSWYSGHVSGFTSTSEDQREPPQSGGMLNQFLYDTTQVPDRLIQSHPPIDQQRRRDALKRMQEHLRTLGRGDGGPRQ